jgi:hypothetical protein
MPTIGLDVPVQSAVDEQHHLRRQPIPFAEKLVDSPRLDVGLDPTPTPLGKDREVGVDPALTPLGKDREVLIRFLAIDLLAAAWPGDPVG